MKRFILLFILSIMIYGCTDQPEYFTVSGEISNANGEKFYLTELKTNQVAIIDSIILSDDGAFRFKGESDIPRFYALRTTADNYLTLIIHPTDQIIIQANGKELTDNPVITGSPESVAIYNLRMRLEKTVGQLDSLSAYYRSIIGTAEQHKMRDSLSKLSQDLISEHTEYTKTFIAENIHSLSSLMALYQQIAPRRYLLNPTDHFEYFKMVDTSLVSKYPESEAVQAFHTQFKEIKRQQDEENENMSAVATGIKAPDIVLPNPDGDTIRLSSLKGKYVLVDFWASWCRPCRIENPVLVKSYQKYNSKGFEIFQVSLDKNKESWTDAIEKDQLDWYHVSDLKFWESEPAKNYRVQGIPANFLLDRQGNIIAKNLRGDALEAKLSEIFD